MRLSRPRGAAAWRARVVGLGAIVALVVLAVVLLVPVAGRLERDLNYPLDDVAIIRAQARAERLDPALVAAVIDAESKFDPRTSSAGALGLMQILPATARYLAHLSGGTAFRVADLAEAKVNIAYGAYYLRFLLDRYHGDETLALAAYNAGSTNVDRWLARVRRSGRHFVVSSIPFPQTRAYVEKVESGERTYRRDYGL